MRTGVVISYNTKVSHGNIKDSNGQKIQFHLEDVHETLSRLDLVRFDIAFVNGSLRAVNISMIYDSNGIPLKMIVS